MREINLRKVKEDTKFEKNILYKRDRDMIVPVIEEHEQDRDIVNLYCSLKDGQYGIFGYEYRSSGAIAKNGWKTTDVLICMVDEQQKRIQSFILDVKRDISAFSDDLFKDGAMITAIKEVRDFIEQLNDENLHKTSFLIYYQADGYEEDVKFGIATRSFEANKFLAVADFLEKLKYNHIEKPSNMPDLIWLKFQRNLNPYKTQVQSLRNFAEKIVEVGGKEYKLQVFLLEKNNESDFEISIPIEMNNK